MTIEAAAQPAMSATRRLVFRNDPLAVLTVASVLLSAFFRVVCGAGTPLWLDETFTGAIAAQPTVPDVVKQILSDVNAPLYYLIAHFWSLLFGLSNASLRFPALICGFIAPILCLIPGLGLFRRTHLIWCSMTALWLPGIIYSEDARCYTLLLCLSAGSTIGFIKLVNEPNLKRALGWALIGSLAILTHYYALILIGLQGLAYLGLHRARALRHWLAALVFIPTFVWIFIHSRTIMAFANPHVAWYSPMDFFQLENAVEFIFGNMIVLFALTVLFATASIFRFMHKPANQYDAAANAPGARIAAWVSLAGVVATLAIGVWRPSFTSRYLMPFIPGLLLGIAYLLVSAQRYWKRASIAAVLFFGAAAIGGAFNAFFKIEIYNFQTASDALIKAGTKNLVFLWDHPANSAEDPAQLAIVGGFFFKRQGINVNVIPVKLAAHQDPNMALLALAARPKPGILWIYDTNVHDTAARHFPPRIAEISPGWRCQDFGQGSIGILACSHGEDTVQ